MPNALQKQGLPGDQFGTAVGISYNQVVVGAPMSDMSGADAGAAMVFERNSGGANNWGYTSLLVNPDGAPGDKFGSSVGISNNYAVVGAPGDSPFGSHSGSAFVFLKLVNGWMIVGQLTDGGGAANDNLGASVAIDYRTVLAGAPLDKVGNNLEQGSALVYEGLCGSTNYRPASRSDLPESWTVEAYPVPFDDVLNIRINTVPTAIHVSLTNSLGQLVRDQKVDQPERSGTDNEDYYFRMQTSGLQQGMYFLRVQAGHEIKTQTLILTRF
ncbi:MAG: T9SS type A sorting domain-containing protein [Lewinellaceae bacterium]|nr:T9SS type A sorting domain-containing protein [Lewinellaceae bacterium]